MTNIIDQARKIIAAVEADNPSDTTLQYELDFFAVLTFMALSEVVASNPSVIFDLFKAAYRAGENNTLHNLDNHVEELIEQEMGSIREDIRNRKVNFPVVSLDREELSERGYDSDDLSDERMEEIAMYIQEWLLDDSSNFGEAVSAAAEKFQLKSKEV